MRPAHPIPWSLAHPYCISCGQESRLYWCLSCQDRTIADAALAAIREWRLSNPWVRRRPGR